MWHTIDDNFICKRCFKREEDEREAGIRKREVALSWIGFGLVVLAIVLHVAFCEWHFDDTATGAYCIIAFSEKANPRLGDLRSKEEFKIVNGLFARNSLPAIGEPVGRTDRYFPRSPGDERYKWIHIGTAPSFAHRTWVLLATIFGVFLPIALLVTAGCALYLRGKVKRLAGQKLLQVS